MSNAKPAKPSARPDTRDCSPPSWAASMWPLGQDLMVLLPHSGHVLRLPLTEGGLTKALKILSVHCLPPKGAKQPQSPAQVTKLLPGHYQSSTTLLSQKPSPGKAKSPSPQAGKSAAKPQSAGAKRKQSQFLEAEQEAMIAILKKQGV